MNDMCSKGKDLEDGVGGISVFISGAGGRYSQEGWVAVAGSGEHPREPAGVGGWKAKAWQ